MVDPNLIQGVVLLGASVVLVPVARRLGLGSVVGYLMAGTVIGPFGLRLLGIPASQVMHFAELGVVMMLFLIGLELSPAKLWRLRAQVLGLGGSQILVTSGALFGLLWVFGLDARIAGVIALSLSLSSTAVAMQTLNERGELSSPAGRGGFAVLLMQDMAVIPMLALIPFILGTAGAGEGPGGERWLLLGQVILATAAIIGGGRLVTRPFFRFVARTGQRELFTALSLLLVLSAALTMSAVGVSPALGAFLAGVVLADSEYRHEIESDLEPFKGLLLGIFFMSVGASVNIELLMASPGLVVGGALALLALKGSILFILGRLGRLTNRQSLQLGLTLSQGSEFAFVLFAFAHREGGLTDDTHTLLALVVGLSMFLTPMLLWLFDRLKDRGTGVSEEPEPADMGPGDRHVIICGFGRFGQIVARLLISNGFRVTLLDQDPDRVALLRGFGFDVHYGDAQRLDMLHAAGAERACVIVLAMDDRRKISAMVPQIRKHFPHLRIAARAIDRPHVYELIEMDVRIFARETFESALSVGREVLRELGLRAYQARRAAVRFRTRDLEEIEELRHLWTNPEAYRSRARAMNRDLHRLLDDDRSASSRIDHAWEVGGTGERRPALPEDPE